MYKRILLLFLIIIIYLAAGCCGKTDFCTWKQLSIQAETITPSVSVEQLKDLTDSDEKTVLIDIRTPEEYCAGYIEGAFRIPLESLETAAKEIVTDLDKKIILYGKSDNFSPMGALLLSDSGYSKVSYLKGGFTQWIKAGYENASWFGKIIISEAGIKDPGIESVYRNNAQKAPGLQKKIKSRSEISRQAKKDAPAISVEELQRKFGLKENFILIDVRTEVEYMAGHISGAILIQRGIAEWMVAPEVDDRNMQIIIYCKKGSRSALTAKALIDIGYRNVRTLDGGINRWAEKGNHLYNCHGKIKVLKFIKKRFNAAEYSIL